MGERKQQALRNNSSIAFLCLCASVCVSCLSLSLSLIVIVHRRGVSMNTNRSGCNNQEKRMGKKGVMTMRARA